MSVKHHPKEEWLLSYAAGAIDESYSLLVATHLAYCAECRAGVATAEDLGGILLNELPSAPLTGYSFDALMARIDKEETGPDQVPAPKAPKQTGNMALPEPLRSYIGGDIEKLGWRFIAPGMKSVLLRKRSDGTKLWMLRAKPGMKIPSHSHSGTEMTLVLQGAFSHEGGRFGRGDMENVDDDLEHQPVIEKGEECICLVLTEGPLHFNSRLVRLIQPLIGL